MRCATFVFGGCLLFVIIVIAIIVVFVNASRSGEGLGYVLGTYTFPDISAEIEDQDEFDRKLYEFGESVRFEDEAEILLTEQEVTSLATNLLLDGKINANGVVKELVVDIEPDFADTYLKLPWGAQGKITFNVQTGEYGDAFNVDRARLGEMDLRDSYLEKINTGVDALLTSINDSIGREYKVKNIRFLDDAMILKVVRDASDTRE